MPYSTPGALSLQWWEFHRLLLRPNPTAAALVLPSLGFHRPGPYPKARTRGRVLMSGVSFVSLFSFEFEACQSTGKKTAQCKYI